MGWFLLVVLALAVVFAIHRLALWADRRGWVFYKTKPRFRGSSLGLIEEMYHPAHQHVIEEETSEQERADVDESGEGQLPGN
jgi:hypothetical protein